MFDFLKKRFNKTIKDASETIPEEESEEQNIEKTDKITEEKTELIEETETSEESSESESSENKVELEEENESTNEKKGRFSFFKRNKKDEIDTNEESEDDNEETSTIEEETDENLEKKVEELKIESSTVEIQKESEEEPNKNESEDKSKDESDDKSKEEKKGRFNFFKRNRKEEEKKQNEETDNEEEVEETVEEVKEETEEKESEEENDEGGRFSFITKKTIKEDDIEEILEELELSLLEGDVAYDVADKIVESVKEDLIGRKIGRRKDMETYTMNALKKAIRDIIDNGSYDLLGDIAASKEKGEPYKIMFVGINGTGKTTTIAKIATYLNKHGYSSVFGASDTFRAGAIEQLEHHAKNLNLKIIKHERNSDPAAVAYDTVEHAKATGKDVVLIDTSGRMQTNTNLMDEMKKIKRVSKPDMIMYVGDALMGNDATEQATKFDEVISIDGIILTKADADAKGGAALSIGHVIHKPILFIGTGQSYDDLIEFEPNWMIDQIFEEEVSA